MEILLKLPVTVRVDNVGAIFMAGIVITMSCNKHMEIRYKYVNEYDKDGIVTIIFVKSADMTVTFSLRYMRNT